LDILFGEPCAACGDASLSRSPRQTTRRESRRFDSAALRDRLVGTIQVTDVMPLNLRDFIAAAVSETSPGRGRSQRRSQRGKTQLVQEVNSDELDSPDGVDSPDSPSLSPPGRRSRVRFSPQVSEHFVTPYSEVYGLHDDCSSWPDRADLCAGKLESNSDCGPIISSDTNSED